MAKKSSYKKGFFGTWGKGKQKGVMQAALYYSRKKRRLMEAYPPNQTECIQWLNGEYRVNSDGIYELIDNKESSKDSSDRLPVNGFSYLGDGTAHILITGLLTTDTITVPSYSDTPTCTVNGRLDIANGDKVGHITISRAGEDIAFYPCEEQKKGVMYNIIPDVANALPNGIITTYIEANFHNPSILFSSLSNSRGYATKSTLAGVYIPLKSDNTPVVADCDVIYIGEVRNNAILNGSNQVTFTGAEYLTCVLVGDETVIDSDGDSTASVPSPNRIDFTAGTMSWLLLSNGDFYKLTNGYGTTIWEVVNLNHAILVGATMPTFYTNDDTGKVRPSNEIDGFSGAIWFNMSTSLLTTATRPASSEIVFHTRIQLGGQQHLRFISKANGDYFGYWSRSNGMAYLKNDSGALVILEDIPSVDDNEWFDIDFTLSGGNYSLTIAGTTKTGSLTGTMTITNLFVGTGQEIRMPQAVKKYSISIDGTLYDYDFSNIGATIETLNGFNATLANCNIGSIPAKNSTHDVLDDLLTNPQTAPTGYLYQNGAESELENYKVPALYKADSLLTTPVIYNHTTFEALRISYDDREFDYGDEHVIFSSEFWESFLVYDSVQSGSNTINMYKFIEAPIVYHNGEIVTLNNYPVIHTGE